MNEDNKFPFFLVTQSVPDPRIVATVEKEIMVFQLSNRNQILVLSVLEV